MWPTFIFPHNGEPIKHRVMLLIHFLPTIGPWEGWAYVASLFSSHQGEYVKIGVMGEP